MDMHRVEHVTVRFVAPVPVLSNQMVEAIIAIVIGLTIGAPVLNALFGALT